MKQKLDLNLLLKSIQFAVLFLCSIIVVTLLILIIHALAPVWVIIAFWIIVVIASISILYYISHDER